MSGKSSPGAASQQATSPTACQNAGARALASRPDASARWAALDSRHERLVTASDAVLAEPNRKSDHRMAS